MIGSSSELVPILGEVSDVVWAPIAGLALRTLYGSNVLFALEFTEEILPFTDILPLATLWCGPVIVRSCASVTSIVNTHRWFAAIAVVGLLIRSFPTRTLQKPWVLESLGLL